MSGGWPVEAFVHDPETLRWFIDEAMATGVPTMATMIVEGIELPNPDALSAALKREARALLDRGPPAWDAEALGRSRYAITDIVDDLRDPRSRAELVASAARLYPLVADHWLRSRGLWSARGKSIPRRLASVAPDFAAAFCAAFDTLFERGDAAQLIALCEQVLAPDGGWLFDGYLLRAPVSSRRIGTNDRPEVEDLDRREGRAVRGDRASQRGTDRRRVAVAAHRPPARRPGMGRVSVLLLPVLRARALRRSAAALRRHLEHAGRGPAQAALKGRSAGVLEESGLESRGEHRRDWNAANDSEEITQ
jgi:hypothetical protein